VIVERFSSYYLLEQSKSSVFDSEVLCTCGLADQVDFFLMPSYFGQGKLQPHVILTCCRSQGW
jgi:hypothetical protein